MVISSSHSNIQSRLASWSHHLPPYTPHPWFAAASKALNSANHLPEARAPHSVIDLPRLMLSHVSNRNIRSNVARSDPRYNALDASPRFAVGLVLPLSSASTSGRTSSSESDPKQRATRSDVIPNPAALPSRLALRCLFGSWRL